MKVLASEEVTVVYGWKFQSVASEEVTVVYGWKFEKFSKGRRTVVYGWTLENFWKWGGSDCWILYFLTEWGHCLPSGLTYYI